MTAMTNSEIGIEVSLWADMFPAQETPEIQAGVDAFRRDVVARSATIREAAVAKGYADAVVVVTGQGMGVSCEGDRRLIASVCYDTLPAEEGDPTALDRIFASLADQIEAVPLAEG